MHSSSASSRSGRLSGTVLLTLLAIAAAAPAEAQQGTAPTLVPAVSIRDLMEKTIAPATDTLWQYYEAPGEESQWMDIEAAAITMLAATSLTAAGGTGPRDVEWAGDARWQAFAQVMRLAAQAALEAARTRDHAALLQAADAIYPPCEGCHSAFHPELVGTD